MFVVLLRLEEKAIPGRIREFVEIRFDRVHHAGRTASENCRLVRCGRQMIANHCVAHEALRVAPIGRRSIHRVPNTEAIAVRTRKIVKIISTNGMQN